MQRVAAPPDWHANANNRQQEKAAEKPLSPRLCARVHSPVKSA